jgi:hypothetical protein
MSIACPSLRFRGMHSRPTLDAGRLILLLSSCCFAASIRSCSSSSKRISSKSESSKDDESSIKKRALAQRHLRTVTREAWERLHTFGGADEGPESRSGYCVAAVAAGTPMRSPWTFNAGEWRRGGVGVAHPRSESAGGLVEQPRSAAAAGGAEGISQWRR